MPLKNLPASAIEAISRVRQSMPDSQLDIADRMATISAHHIPTFRDDALKKRIDRMKRSLVAHYSGDEKQHRILFVIGDSHSGKSSLIEHVLATDPAFDTYVDSDGVDAMTVLLMDGPSPCTLRNIAYDGLEKLGYPVKANLTESRIWPLFREQLKRRKVLFIVIDEAQHAVKNNTSDYEIQKVRDTFKHLVQMPDWPIRLILCGVSPLERLREGDKQIETRSTMMRLGSLTAQHTAHVVSYIELVVTRHAELRLGDFLGGDFAERVIHACGGCFGSIVKLIRLAVENTLLKGDATVTAESFAAAYGEMSGCSPTSNIFTASEWQALEAGAAKIVDHSDEDTPSAPKPKRIRAGERRA
ncbi:unnamed protein product [Ciceribacter sp. T2.26MG-112.2]|uniref:ATP-binding protein n=1 Tax=Ciceribacter sp. T2.26MG-112.2 TaxID=3137154 RepID=UPI000E157E52|nr:ATP-binding protein [Ciceribacter naphthalenivorans]SSC71427.1 unnamed protein product [Ciceribacter naphthalenivorans]